MIHVTYQEKQIEENEATFEAAKGAHCWIYPSFYCDKK